MIARRLPTLAHISMEDGSKTHRSESCRGYPTRIGQILTSDTNWNNKTTMYYLNNTLSVGKQNDNLQ